MIALAALCVATAHVTGLFVSDDPRGHSADRTAGPAHGLCPAGRRRSGPRGGRSARRVDRRRATASIGHMNPLSASRRIAMTAAGVPLAALTVAACGGSSDAPRPPKTTSGRPATVGLEPAGGLGKVLVDSRGRTLYLCGKGAGGRSFCVAACAAAWPPVRAQGMPLAGTGVSPAKLTTTARSDGAPQILYNGQPLYRYTGDAKPGDTNGQRVTAFGAAWFAVSGAGQVISRPASKPAGEGIY
jgi:predicted lipoprotein with Yx(FWY)xxD motif